MKTMQVLTAAIALLLGAMSAGATAADWTQDWFDQAATTPSSSYKTQERGYYTAGGFQGRWRMTNDYPVSVTAPRFNAGCGGIDLFGGGFSYLDPEYMVEKFERIIQAAPAFAFEMAMQEYCKPCSSAMQTMTQITDYLNSIQVNDCRMAKQIAAIPVKQDMSLFDDMKEKAMQGYALGQGILKNTQNVEEQVRANNGASPIDVREMIAECPSEFRTIFADGSVVNNVAGLLGLSAYQDLSRGLIGDVVISYNSALKNYSVQGFEPCPGNDPASGIDLVTGKLEKKTIAGACSASGASTVSDFVEAKLTSIADKLAPSSGGGLSADDYAFINSSPFPILNLLRDAVVANLVPETISAIRDPLANGYAYRMMNDLHRMTYLVLAKANEVKDSQRFSTGNPNRCDTKYLQDGLTRIASMGELSIRYREMAKANYAKEQQELATNYQVVAQMLEQRRALLRENAAVVK